VIKTGKIANFCAAEWPDFPPPLTDLIARELYLKVDPSAMFDVHVKRIHEYKRQLLNILETVSIYQQMRADPHRNWTPRVKIFAGKAAASYVQAKSIIKLINDVARTINADPAVRDILKVAFIPNFNVSLAEVMVPAADLSEQISTAGTEASGTGNMKFALNGAITIGTLDGANVEIRERVGEDNIVIFGLTAAGVEQTWRDGYRPGDIINGNPKLKAVLDAIAGGEFSPEDRTRFVPLVNSLYNDDRFLIAADFASYEEAQRRVDGIWADQSRWTQMTMRNTANVGWFSSDRTIREYADEIWQVPCDFLAED
jgi:glycogen phosphorylase